ncbi:MAG: FprA family A-type flavoprotein [Acutalibacteraceae bacterium]|nr:FprA family A-type flavoprotein [Acutalibacteraceae bacterium]
MQKTMISEDIKYIGVDDKTLDLFEGQYIVPNGVSYNSYLIIDEKIAVMDTVDSRAIEEWLQKLDTELDGKQPDYLVVSHMEPDHGAGVRVFAEKYPSAKIVGNAKTFTMMSQFFDMDISDRKLIVKEGDKLELGKHSLTFIMAPMVHWPEVMVCYESTDKVLFSADAFGKFGALDADEDWTCEARRYYINIVGKYGAQVQALLKKAGNLDIKTICPLHGPILNENLEYYINKYDIWSSYRAENEGVMIAYVSMHGNTAQAAKELKEKLEKCGVPKVAIADLARDDMAEAIEDSFRYDRLVVASPTYDGALFPIMEDFLYHLKMKNYQNRKVAIIENGSWAPMAGKKMKEHFEGMKNITLCDTVVTIKSALNENSREQIDKLAEELV